METNTQEEITEEKKEITHEWTEEEFNKNATALQKWRMALEQAQRDNFFTDGCILAACDWGNCAIGSRLQIENPKFINYVKSRAASKHEYMKMRLTPKAYELGMKFAEATKNAQPEKARKIFDQIQKLPEVLREEGKKYHWWEYLGLNF